MFFTWSYNSYFANEQVLVALSVPVHYESIVFNTIYNNHATIIDFVGTIIVWGIITVLRLWQLLCIYLFPNITNV